MKYCVRRHYLTVMIMGFLVIVSNNSARPESGFHVKSDNLPATLKTNNSKCRGSVRRNKIPGPGYVSGRDASGRYVVPADSVVPGNNAFPVVRFDLGFGRRLKRQIEASGIKNSRLRARDLTAGEVSVDIYSGEVALDGQPLSPTDNQNGCIPKGPE